MRVHYNNNLGIQQINIHFYLLILYRNTHKLEILTIH